MARRARLAALLFVLTAAPLAAQHDAKPAWRQFQADALRITFRYPPTPGLRVEPRPATCAPADGMWQGHVSDSTIMVSRTVAPFAQIASNLGLAREGDHWVAQGYQGTRSAVAVVHAGGWDALVTRDAVTVVYDLALQAPVAAQQWRFLAMGPAADGCRPLLLGIATGLAAAWDSATVAALLAGARPRVP